jgi:hypothetical protein
LLQRSVGGFFNFLIDAFIKHSAAGCAGGAADNGACRSTDNSASCRAAKAARGRSLFGAAAASRQAESGKD